MPVKVAIAQINSTVGDFDTNNQAILDAAKKAADMGADILITPELSLTGNSPMDLLFQDNFHEAVENALTHLKKSLKKYKGLHVLVGHPKQDEDGIGYNACTVFYEGKTLGTYCKQAQPNNGVSDQTYYFASGGMTPLVFTVKGTCFGVIMGDDIALGSPASAAQKEGADVILCVDSTPFSIDAIRHHEKNVADTIVPLGMATLYTNTVGGQDEFVFTGNAFAMDNQGTIRARLKHAEEDFSIVTCDKGKLLDARIELPLTLEAATYFALVLGVKDYVRKNGFPGAVLGLSGGVDSALVLAIAYDALGADNVRVVMMPSQYTSDMSNSDAQQMAQTLGIRYDILPITPCFDAFKQTLEGVFTGLPEDVTEENLQARTRGTLLMAISNKTGYLVLTTGNKSETAVGYCTLYGDMAGGFAVIRDIYKTLVYRLCRFRNGLSDIIPERILTRAPSAELKPGQRDQDSLPPYEILDFILHEFMEERMTPEAIVAKGFPAEEVDRVITMIRRSEYKRIQAPVGMTLTSRGFGSEWHYPVTSKFRG
ncbi:MAG: NAD+ synthase [Oxalobacter sp.]|nr:NAD+ synthase [Oxalobacter sp.]